MAKPQIGASGKIFQRARWLMRQCAGLATFAFCLVVTAMAMAQQHNPFDPKANKGGGQFKAAPVSEDAEAASGGLDYIMGVHINTLFFVTAGLIGIYWFTMGGGRKARVSRDSS